MEHESGAGFTGSPSPKDESRGKGGFPSQTQQYPGSEAALSPPADHGERSYRGSGRLEGRTALITGGDSGIGRAVAIAFAREGADVAITYLDSHDDADETLRWVRDAGRRGFAEARDLRDPAACREAVARATREFGRLGILVNNAAYQAEQERLEDITPEQLDRTFRTNIFAYFWMAQAALPGMREGDVILNTGSVAALRGNPKLVDYAATKAAIHNFSTSLAAQVAPRGIRVNVVAPGPVWTPLNPATRSGESVAHLGAKTLWERAAQPAEIAPSYVFLASADARYYTGQVLAPTGSEAPR